MTREERVAAQALRLTERVRRGLEIRVVPRSMEKTVLDAVKPLIQEVAELRVALTMMGGGTQ